MAENTIVGVFDNQKEAEEVAKDLKREGFSGNDIHIIDEHGKEHFGWFSRLFGYKEEEDTLAYREALRNGKAVVAVDTDEEQVERAADIMERHGAIDIEDSEGKPIEPMRTQPMRSKPRSSEPRSTTSSGEQSIPVVEENVNIGKRRVLHGGVRVYGQLNEEQAKVERRPADPPVSAEEASKMRDKVMEIAETREGPVVNKAARVAEEVVVAKETSQRQETARDMARRTDVNVEPLAQDAPIPTDIAAHFRNNFQTQYAGRNYSEYEAAYHAGYRAADRIENRSKNFDEIEDQIRAEFERSYPKCDWPQMRNAVRHGWDRARGNI